MARRRAFIKNVIRAITGNPARFAAIFGIVAIGAGVYAGLRAFVPDMYASADALYDETCFADLQVVSEMGLTPDDVEAVAGVEGVSGALGVASYETVMRDADDTLLQVQIEALPMAAYEGPDVSADAISRLIVRQGRLPRGPGEIAVSSNGRLKEEDVDLGDVLTAREVMGVGEAGLALSTTEFAVVGIVSSPEWLSVSTGLSPTTGARVTNYAYVDRSSLAEPDLYTAIVATVEGARAQEAFSQGYDDVVAPVREAVKAIAPARERARYEELAARAREAAEKLERAHAAAGGSGEGAGPLAAAFSDFWEDAERRARDARDSIEPGRWYVLTRDANPSYYVYKATAMRMDRICMVFPTFFFLVAALVCLTTMGRMVENDRVEIGTLKALGYPGAAIAAKYLAFCGLASGSGALTGVLAGVRLLPWAIWTPYSVMYLEMPFHTGLRQPSSAVAIALSVGLACLACCAASYRTLRDPAARLLLPPAPKGGRRIALERARPLWRRMSFSQKVAARNVFRYKARMVMTIAGVAGCCGLMLCGFGVQNKLDGFVEAQYGGIYTFDLMAFFDADADPGAAAGSPEAPLARAFDGALGEGRWTYLYKRACIVENEQGDPARIAFGVGGRLDRTGGSVQAEMREGRSDWTGDDARSILRDAALYVFPDGSDQGFIEIDDTSGKRLALPGQGAGGASDPLVPTNDGRRLPGAVLTLRLAEQLTVGVGDAVGIELDGEGRRVEVGVAGIMDNLVGHFIYMSPAALEAATGSAPEYNMALAWAPEGLDVAPGTADAAALKEGLLAASPSLTSVTLALDESDGYEDIAASLNSIVVILLAVSSMLAFIVVYALTEINVEERRREIATIKVLGFTPREVRAYVYRETYALSGIGIACGLPFGVRLCDFVMRSAEFDNVIYFRSIDPWCYLASAAGTAVVAAVVTLAMRRRLAGIEMVSSLKSVD